MKGRKWLVRGVAGVALGWLSGGEAPAQAPPQAPPPAAAAPAARPAAVVNGEPISTAELEAVLKQAGPMPVEVPEEVRRQMRRQALGMLIEDTVMHQFLRATAPQVSKAEVDQKLAEMEAELRKQNKSVEAFCKETGQTVEQLREGLGYMMRWSAWAKAKISDADVQRYYQENKDFFDGVTVRASHIVLRVPPTAPEADRAKAKAQLTELRNQIVAGKLDFAAAAKTYSQCPSKEQGGDLGFFPRKWMVEESFAKAAFATPPGQVSDVVQTDYGLHLIKVTERKPGQPSDFAQIKDQVRDFCTEEMRLAVLAQQRQAAKIEVNIP